MNSNISRFLQSLHTVLTVLFLLSVLLVGLARPTYAQSAPAPVVKPVSLHMSDGWSGKGKHVMAANFVIVCPTKEVLDPNHPCSNTSSNMAQSKFSQVKDFVLVCPNKEVLDPNHPCYDRNTQIKGSMPADFVLVCPTNEVLDPKHPCSQQNSSAVQFKIPGDFVLTCPVKEVLQPQHPCAGR